ncbi:hypothetical protein [Blastococcus sp. CCUG 61487]|uniref:hypothetical protein n=1 Tax=Blastococcus sp. CCUG 61487 TaxID=1840703 RepID=UPI0010BFF471|nr:hypothetical protein [Blastococcus sp. CCUG 61487]TKJ34219.1 hypothetical protein A6V29_15255 [Blastococcus sp. CCUG 61487]
MSARSGEWHLLGRSRDPVPGEPTEADRLARGYESTADDIARLAGQLRRLARLVGWEGEAAEAFGESADDLAGDLARAERRYRELAAAVRGWSPPLERARDESAGALREAIAADDERRRYAADPLAGVSDPTPAQVEAHQRRDAARAAAADRLRAAQHRLDAAVGALDDAARHTAERIGAAAEHGGDNLWDDVKGTVRDHAGVLAAIADVLGYVAIALAAITLVVVLLVTAPAWLIALGVAAGVALLALHTALVVSESGEATWTDVGLDLVGLATAGLGARQTVGMRNAVAGLRSSAAAEVGAGARATQEALERGAANHTRAGNALHIRNPRNGLRLWARRYLDEAAARVSDAGVEAAARGEADAVTDAPWRLRLQTFDREMAQHLLELDRLAALPVSPGLRADLSALAAREAATLPYDRIGLAVHATGGADQLSGDLDGPEWLRWKADVDQTWAVRQWRSAQVP